MKVYSYTAGGAITEILKVISGDVELVDCWDLKGASKNSVTATNTQLEAANQPRFISFCTELPKIPGTQLNGNQKNSKMELFEVFRGMIYCPNTVILFQEILDPNKREFFLSKQNCCIID
jgi:hypothetical protein